MTWIHLPSSVSTQAPVVLTSVSDWQFLELEQSATWREKSPRSAYLLRVSKQATWMMHLFGMMPTPSTATRGVAKWIGSLEGHHANRSLRQEANEEPKIPETDGLTLSEWYEKFSQQLASSRMSHQLDLFTTTGGRSDPGFKHWAIELRKSSPKRLMQVIGIIDDELSSLPTVTAKNLEEAAENWTTPTGDDVRNRRKQYEQGGTPLSLQAMWWTPTSNEDAAGTRNGKMQYMLSHQVQEIAQDGPLFSNEDPTLRQRRRLNPKFVEWLMGLPEGWLELTSCESSEIQ